ncbi:hypothetical protein PED38_01010 [Clavibacter sp. CT19]|uniref:hypothetical protein n=1 Tax=Clavibacter sp. CT19 TaxID=3018990 RepID=UPI0022EA3CBF|nr:hypothetical protein [Clavibacter sp. CT19]MDA3803372.1 hypothetical protein [Clavibacter sp. CT19]
MWSKQSGDASGAISPVPEHPHAHPVRGAWLVRVGDGPALGWVLRLRADLADPFSYEVYACGLGADGLRVWVARRTSLNAAVAWVVQHDRELLAFSARLRPDPLQPAGRGGRSSADGRPDEHDEAVATDTDRDAAPDAPAHDDAAAPGAGDGGVGTR